MTVWSLWTRSEYSSELDISELSFAAGNAGNFGGKSIPRANEFCHLTGVRKRLGCVSMYLSAPKKYSEQAECKMPLDVCGILRSRSCAFSGGKDLYKLDKISDYRR